MNHYFYSTLILFSFFYCLFLSGCKEGATEPQNRLPKIESLTANPTTVLVSTETTLTCIATDEDGDNLTITWSSKRGTYSNGVVGVAVKWVAPSTAGKDTITAIVNDGKQTIQGKLEIIVGTVPASPTLAAPANNATEVALSPTLTWNAISNAVSYTLQVSANNSFSSFVYNQSGLTNTSQLISGLNSNATYYWRVSSTNIYGTSSWSSVFSFKTLASPIAPTLLTPANNAIDISLTTTLNWNALTNASSYTLQVSENNSFTSFVYNQTNLTNLSQQISGLNYFTIYYWRVNAINYYGTSGWSSTWSFTALGTAPQAPVLLTPINSAVNISLSPTLGWNSSTYATSYTLQISENNSFTSFIFNQSGLTTTNRSISGLNNWTKYYWRVNAMNTYGTSSWSEIWSYTTILATPMLSLPVNGAMSIPILPTLSWNAVSGATAYSLQVSLTNNFSSFVYNQSGLTSTNQQISGLNHTSIYYWRVSATNSFGTSNWANYWSFATQSLKAPTLVSPVNSATEVSITPALSWNVSTDAASYTLQISVSSSFSSFVFNQSGLTGTGQQINELSNFTKYYWRVSATNSFGISSWANYWTFTTISGACLSIPTVTYEGKTYNTAQIGTQCWLKENLDVGTMIQVNQNPSNNATIEKYCYNNNPNNCATYGGLYQWNEAMAYGTTPGSKGICPDGWHIPTRAELETLTAAVNSDGNALKKVGQGNGTNISGFSAMLAGFRYNYSSFGYLGQDTFFWSSTEYYGLSLYQSGNIILENYVNEVGYSLRCIKN